MIREALFAHCSGPACRTADGQTLPWAQLHDRAAGIAAFLRARGVRRLLLCGAKGPDFMTAIAGCLLAGTAYIPVDDDTPLSRRADILRASAAGAVLDLRPQPDWPAGVPIWTLAEAASCSPLAALPPAAQDDIAYILFTSGSTGAPKGVCVTYGNVENFLRWFCALPAVAAARPRTVLGQARFSFDLSVAELYYVFLTGGCLIPALPANTCAAELAVFTPSFADLCLLDEGFCAEKLPSLRVFFFCGEVLRPAAVRRLHARFPAARVLNAYGPTEATCAVSAAEIDDTMLTFPALPIGRAAGEAVDIRPVDEALRPLPAGKAGRLLLTGASVAAGYLGEETGFGGTFLTGDIGCVRDGWLWYLGRADDQIKYKGYRIEPAEIEAALCALPGVRQAAVVPCRLPDGRVTGLTAHIAGDNAPGEAEILAALRERLPAYMVPKRVVCRAALPLTGHGKIDRKELKGC